MASIEYENAQSAVNSGANPVSTVPTLPYERQALASLVIDNAELEELESLLGQFNIFEAIGAVRNELRHSDFLAFLLDPQGNHALGDTLARRLLQRVVASGGGAIPTVITPIDFDVWSLSEMTVLREWQNIDILMVSHIHKLAVIIENKIGSSEHSNQLGRYYAVVQEYYPGWNVIAVYLTAGGTTPSDDRYTAVPYKLVGDLIETLARSRASTLGPEVQSLMLHYTQMLRRHIVSDSEVAELCRRIYRKHRAALDLIFEHRPDQQDAVSKLLESLVSATPELLLDKCTKSEVMFTIMEWEVTPLLQGEGWTSSRRMLLFTFLNESTKLTLRLMIGPGPQPTRQDLFKMARENTSVLKPAKTLYDKWSTIWSQPFLRPKDYEEEDPEALEGKVKTQWGEFLHHTLPRIRDAMKVEQVGP